MQKRKMPRDVNQRATSIVDMVAALSEGEEPEPELPAKDPERVERGRLGGANGGKLRAERLSPERRAEIARMAAAARWGGRSEVER